MPKVSIIVPVYNVENKIKRCLDSIKKQEMQDFECILVDDGSTDSSGLICDEYAHIDSRFHTVHRKNGGASTARNTGIEASSGEWITFIDSDDWVSPQYISSYFNGKMADIVFQGITRETAKETYRIRFAHSPSDNIIENIYFIEQKDLLGWSFNKIFKANIIKEKNIRFPTDIILREDSVFTLQYLYYAESIAWRDVEYYHYIETSGSLMSQLRPYKELTKCNDLLHHLRCRIIQKYPSSKYATWVKNEYLKYKITIIRYAFYHQYRLPKKLRYQIIKDATNIAVNFSELGKTDQLIKKITHANIPIPLKDLIINIISQAHGRKYYKGQL